MNHAAPAENVWASLPDGIRPFYKHENSSLYPKVVRVNKASDGRIELAVFRKVATSEILEQTDVWVWDSQHKMWRQIS